MASRNRIEIEISADQSDFEDGLNRVIDAINEVTSAVSRGANRMDEAISGLGTSIQSDVSSITDSFDEMGTGIEDNVSSASGSFGNFGSAATVGIGLAIAAAAAVGAAVLLAGKSIFDFAQESETAFNQLKASTGATEIEMAALEQTAFNLFKGGLGENIAQVADAIGEVKRITGKSGEELELLTKRALQLEKVLGIDVKESVRAVDTAMVAFGVKGSLVFDGITKVIQSVGDPADDLADTVNEYSPIFAKAGFSAEQMFGILQTGLDAGARNFDIVGDAVKEFTLRITEGGDDAIDALDKIFAAVQAGETDFSRLTDELGRQQEALDKNNEALLSAEGAYAATKEIVDGLKGALSDARRELSGLSNPKLAGMEAFNHQIATLKTESKKAKLNLIGLEKGTPDFEAGRAGLKAINQQIDRLALERDIKFEPQLRAIEEAINGSGGAAEAAKNFDQIMAEIASKKTKIAEVGGALSKATAEMNNNQSKVAGLTTENEQLSNSILEIRKQLDQTGTPARKLFEQIQSGEKTAADAFDFFTKNLSKVDGKLRNQVGVALMGTQFEDLSEKIVTAMDSTPLKDFDGALGKAADELGKGLSPAWEKFKSKLLVASEPLGRVTGDIIERLIPSLVRLGDWLGEKIPPLADRFSKFFDENIAPSLAIVIDAIVEASAFALPIFARSWELLLDNMNIVKPVLAVIGAVILALTAPLSAVAVAIGLLVVGWTQDWGGIKTAVFDTWEKIKPTVLRGVQFIKEKIKDGLQVMKDFWAEHKEEIMVIVNFVWDTAKRIFELGTKIVGIIVEKGLQFLSDFWDEWGDTITDIATNAWENIGIAVEGGMKFVGTIIDAVAGIIEGDWDGFGQTLNDLWEIVWDTVSKIVENNQETINKVINKVITFIKEKIWIPFKDWMIEKWGELWTAVSDKVNEFLKPITDPIEEITNKIQNLIEKINNLTGLNISLPGFGGRDMQINKIAPLNFDHRPPIVGRGGNVNGNNINPEGKKNELKIGTININANSKEGGEKAGRGLVDELRRQGFALQLN